MCFYSWSKLVSIYNVSILVLLLWQFWFRESVNMSPSLCRCVFSDLNLHIILYTHVNFGSIVCSNFGFSESVNLSGVAVRPRKKSKHCCYQALLTQFPLSNQVSFRKKQFESLFFWASHLGTAVESVHTCTHTHPTHARLTTPHMYKQTYNYTQMSNLETASILRSPEDSVGDGRVAIPLWLHTWEAADFNWKLLKGTTVPGWDTSIETRLRTRAGRSRTSDPSQLSYDLVLEFVVYFDCTSYFSSGANLGV